MNKKLLRRLKFRLILAWVNAINGTNLNTSRIFRANARFANDVNCHYVISFLKNGVKLNCVVIQSDS